MSDAGGTPSKDALRRRFRSLRLQQLEAAQPGLERAAAELAAGLEGERLLGIFWPLPGEADLRPLAQRAGLSQRLALPRVEAGQLRYRSWQPGDPLIADDTRIPAPEQGADLAAEQLELLLVPALAMDQRGIRLGYGGGWFDRLRRDPAWRRIPALGVLPAGCVVQQLPADPWDVPFSGWLDEGGVRWLQGV
jgi:5-formyltetrahydrofolate cyclo-ligase